MAIEHPYVHAWVWCRWEGQFSQVLLDGFKGRAMSPFVDGVVRGALKATISSVKTAIRFDGVKGWNGFKFPPRAIRQRDATGERSVSLAKMCKRKIEDL